MQSTNHTTVREPQYWESRPPGLEDYMSADFTHNGVIAQDLFSGVASEVTNIAVVNELIGDESGLPANITVHMRAWYHQHIAPLRSAALSGLKRRFAEDTHRSVPTFIMEARRDEIISQTAQRKQQAVTDFKLEFSSRVDERDHAERAYEQEKARHGGREPVVRSGALYILLLAALAVLEFFLNFETLLASPLARGIPALALGMTLTVALSIALASHLQGMLIKQWHFHMRSADEARKRRFLWLNGILSALLEGIGLGLIGFGRYFLVMTIVERAVLMGNDPPSVVGMMFGTMFGNVAIWLLGSVISYYFHDDDPDYPGFKVRYDALKAAVDKGYQDKVVRKIRELTEVCRETISTEEMQDRLQAAGDIYQKNRRHFDDLVKKDREVEGLLHRYRENVRKQFPNARFSATDMEMLDATGRAEISAPAWAASPLRLKYYEGGR